MSDWQPMESAPRDGTRILVCQLRSFRHDGERVRFARWKEGRWASTDPIGSGWDESTLLAWRAVPAPPPFKF